jgi:hypothetical protein
MSTGAKAYAVERQRRERVGLVVSVAVHLLVLAYVIAILPQQVQREDTPEQIVTITRRLTIERRPKPAPTAIAHVAVTTPKPQPQRRSQPVVSARVPVTVPRAALPAPAPRLHRRVAAQKTPRTLAFVPHHAARPAEAHPARVAELSSARISRIDRDLGDAIAADRAGRNVLAGTETQPDYASHYSADVGSFTTGELRHHGLCDPIKNWNADGYDYYFVSCNVRFSDGTYERQPVPWPVRFKPNHDPFNGTFGGEEPLAIPLPGWTLPAGETISKELREYVIQQGGQLPPT